MKPKILIIDDEIHIVELIRFNLETSGYEVDIAYDGLDGYLKIKENAPQLVLLDWMLPNISGIDMLKKRRYNINKENVENILTVGSLNVNLLKHEVFKGNEKIDLTLKEFELLKLLLESKGKVLSRNYLLDKIWGYDYYGDTRIVDAHIKNLRKKIKLQYIKTVKGIGYTLEKSI